VKRFFAPKKTLGAMDAEAAATLIARTADIALIVDQHGVIRDVSLGNDQLAAEIDDKWLNQAWVDIVTIESRPKIETLLRDVDGNAPVRWRQVNHPIEPGRPDLPVTYSVLPLANTRRIVAIGRDLRAVSAMQRRVAEVEQAIERDYSTLRFTETRYNLLFQISSEAVIIVDAATQRVTEANPAAAQLMGTSARRLIGRNFPEGFDAPSTQLIQGMLSAVRVAGRAPEIRVRRTQANTDLVATATMFRMSNASYFLVQFQAQGGKGDAPVLSKVRAKVLDVIETSPDGLVLTDLDGRILFANRAFLDLAQLATEEQARGERLDRWIGRPGADLDALKSNLRQHESVRMYSTTLRGEYGSEVDVEISAVAAPDGEQPCHGFSIRSVLRHSAQNKRVSGDSPRSLEHLTKMVGRMGLKDMVRESTDAIERMCIEAALELAGDNRASAAEILGLSRQSLYVKLRRYGLGDLSNVDPDDRAN